MYEVAWLVENLLDPGLAASKAMAQLWLELGRNLADSLVIPFNVTDYAVMVASYINELDSYLSQSETAVDQDIPHYLAIMDDLRNAQKRFLEAAIQFQSFVNEGNLGMSSLNLRMVQMLNSRLVALERSFIDPQGLPGRPLYRHVVFAPNAHNSYEGMTFAGVKDSAKSYREAKKLKNSGQMNYWMKYIRIALTSVQYSIESATLLLDTS